MIQIVNREKEGRCNQDREYKGPNSASSEDKEELVKGLNEEIEMLETVKAQLEEAISRCFASDLSGHPLGSFNASSIPHNSGCSTAAAQETTIPNKPSGDVTAKEPHGRMQDCRSDDLRIFGRKEGNFEDAITVVERVASAEEAFAIDVSEHDEAR
jgi:hypothetical protein